MNAIARLVSDPAWWFTAIFVGTVVGVAGSFLKDAIASVSASLSRKSADRKHARDQEIELAVQALLDDDNLLLLEYMRTQVQRAVVLTILMTALAMSLLVVGFPQTHASPFAFFIYLLTSATGVWASWHNERPREIASKAYKVRKEASTRPESKRQSA